MSIRQLRRWTLASAWVALLGASAGAQTPPIAPSPLDLTQVLQAARRNPDARAAEQAAQAARADVRSADRAPAPTLSTGAASIDLQRGTGTGSFWNDRRIDKALGLDWTWERGHKRALRTQAAERGALAAQADSQDVQLLQQIGAQAAFYELLASQERLSTLQALADSARALGRTAERRLQAGDLSAQDAARTHIEAERTHADLQAAQWARQQAALALAAWMGQGVPPEGWQAQGPWPTTQASTAPDLERLLEQRPDVVAARQRMAATQAAAQGAQALRLTDPTLGATVDHFPNGQGTQRLLALRLSFPLNSPSRFEGEIGRTLAQQQLAQELLDKALVQGRAELQALWQAQAAQAARLHTYDTLILPQAQQVAAQAELAYAKGGLPLTDLLDARRTLRATQLEALAVRAEHAKALGAWQLRSTRNPPLDPPARETRP